MPTVLSCIDNSWRSTTLEKLTSSTANLEWCHVYFIRDSYSTFIRRVVRPSKNSIELFFNAKFDFKSTWNRDSTTSHHRTSPNLGTKCKQWYLHSDTWIFINWIWIATRFRHRQIWRTGSGNSAILAPKSSVHENREKTPIFETKAAVSFLMLQGVWCLK